ncbi:MAG: HlyD family efflux transporter periplasmic adaptor subunit [Roseiarcus sp.]|jgi:multidrug resistance efflux pump
MKNRASTKPAIFVPAPEPGQRAVDRPTLGAADPAGAVANAEERDAALDVRSMQSALVQAFEDEPPGRGEAAPAPGEAKPAQEAQQPARRSLLSRASPKRFVKAGVGIALLVTFGWMPLQTLLLASSVEAVVNSRIVTVRSPIDGVVAAAPQEFKAWSAAKGAPVLRIRDDKADRGRLDDLRRQLGALEDQRPKLARQLQLAQANLDELTKQTQQFTEGRIRQLNARVAALGHDVVAAAARAEEADAALARANALVKSGTLSAAEVGRLRRDKIVADENEAGARQRLEEASVELAAANQGAFLGDSYNDRPSSAQRADEMRLRVGDLAADLQANDAALERARAAVADEETRYQIRSDVEIALPVSGRVWEVLTAPGEHVSRGQDLMRLLDCASAVITANVSESVYNRLQVGSPATFRPSTGGDSYAGSVVNLTGSAGAPANFAIIPSSLIKEAYHVTVAVPEIAESGECSVGRTGRVTFEDGAVEAGATSADARALGLRRD